MNIVGINGYKRSGKGTVAGFLSDNHPGVVYEIGFADKVKQFATRALGFQRPPRDLVALADQLKLDPTEGGAYLTMNYREQTGGPATLHDLTGRQLLQWVGTEARDLFGSDFWVDQVLPVPAPREDPYGPAVFAADDVQLENDANVAARYPEIDVVAITDLRFENEAERVLDLGGTIWRVTRPGAESDGHASEQPLPDSLVSHEIDNSGDLDDLNGEVRRAIMETLTC